MFGYLLWALLGTAAHGAVRENRYVLETRLPPRAPHRPICRCETAYVVPLTNTPAWVFVGAAEDKVLYSESRGAPWLFAADSERWSHNDPWVGLLSPAYWTVGDARCDVVCNRDLAYVLGEGEKTDMRIEAILRCGTDGERKSYDITRWEKWVNVPFINWTLPDAEWTHQSAAARDWIAANTTAVGALKASMSRWLSDSACDSGCAHLLTAQTAAKNAYVAVKKALGDAKDARAATTRLRTVATDELSRAIAEGTRRAWIAGILVGALGVFIGASRPLIVEAARGATRRLRGWESL